MNAIYKHALHDIISSQRVILLQLKNQKLYTNDWCRVPLVRRLFCVTQQIFDDEFSANG